MKTRRRLSTADVVDAAVALVDQEGPDALTLTRVATELGIKTPSLYNHVSGLDALERDVALRAVEDVGRSLATAVMGRSGRDALRATARALREYVTEHPGLYALSARARPQDAEIEQAQFAAIEPVLAVLHGFDLDGDQAIHAARTLRAALHGFVALEMAGGFGLDVDVDESFDWLVDRLAEILEATARQ